MSHTPGPWRVQGWEIMPRSKRHGRICLVSPVPPTSPGTGESCHNAALIAAAPDLFDAVKAVLAALDGGDESAMDEAEDLCRAAITKASTP